MSKYIITYMAFDKWKQTRPIEAEDEDEAIIEFIDQFHCFEGFKPEILSIKQL